MFFFICAWTNGWVNSRDDGDLRRHHAHYDIIVVTDYKIEYVSSEVSVSYQRFRKAYVRPNDAIKTVDKTCNFVALSGLTWLKPEYPGKTRSNDSIKRFLAATKQLYKWYFLSVRPSVCLSVTPFWLCSHHRIIMKFSGVITNDQSKVHAKGQGQRWKVKVTEVTTQLNRFRTVTPVWIHIWWWNDAYSLMLLRRGALLFFKVIRQISRSHGSKNRRIWPRMGVSGL